MAFGIKRKGDDCDFTAKIVVRVGPIGARINRKEVDAVRKHMEEEGENLKAIIEQAT